MKKATVVLLCAIASSVLGQDKDSPSRELIALRQQFDTRKKIAVRPIQLEYKQALQTLENNLIQRKDLAGAAAVQQEIAEVSADLSGVETKTYVSEVRGIAGCTSQNNIYSFDIKRAGMRATLRYWASGDIGLDTNGRILLTTPEGKEVDVGVWKPKDFNTTTARVRSYKELREKTCDISKETLNKVRFSHFAWDGGRWVSADFVSRGGFGSEADLTVGFYRFLGCRGFDGPRLAVLFVRS